MLCRTARLFAITVLIAAAAFGQNVSGSWTATASDKRTERINFQFYVEGSSSSHLGHDLPLAALSGLTADILASGNSDVKFELRRDAGVTRFQGHFNNGKGAGDFTFVPDPEYLAGMSALGYRDIPRRELFTMAIIDVSRAHAREMKELGFHPTLDELIETRIFDVNRQQIEGLKSVGYGNLSLQKLVEAQIFHVTPEYIRDMRQAGFDGGLDTFVAMRIHGVTPEFRQQMADAGYPKLSNEKLTEFRIHGITPAFIKEMAALGFRGLSPDQLIELRIFHVDAAQINEMKSLGYTDLTPSQLVQLRVHGIDRAFIERVHHAGHQHPTIDQLVEMKIMGIHRDDAMF